MGELTNPAIDGLVQDPASYQSLQVSFPEAVAEEEIKIPALPLKKHICHGYQLRDTDLDLFLARSADGHRII